jgi:hypothetical protein
MLSGSRSSGCRANALSEMNVLGPVGQYSSGPPLVPKPLGAASIPRSARTMSPQPSIAHYRITSKLGEDGMGAVYRATDTALNREVVVGERVLPNSAVRHFVDCGREVICVVSGVRRPM